MRRTFVALLAFMLFAPFARAEYHRLEISIFGMD